MSDNKEKQEKKELVLKGTVQLDGESMCAIREEVRASVLEQIARDGLFKDELEKFMRMCSYKKYLEIVSETIAGAVKKAEQDDSHWNDDLRAKKRLQAIASVLKL